MGVRGKNKDTFAVWEELDIAVDDDSPFAYIYKRLDSEKHKDIEDRSWYIGIPVPNSKNGKRLSLRTSNKDQAKRKARQKVIEVMKDLQTGVDIVGTPVRDFVKAFLRHKESLVRGVMEGKKDGGVRSITKERYGLIESKVRNYFVPFVGEKTSAKTLKYKKFDDEWESWRKQNPAGRGNKKVSPKQVTIKDEMGMIRELWGWGQKEKFIDPLSKMPFDDYNLVEDEKIRRDTWEQDEWNKFKRRLREWLKNEKKSDDSDRIWESFVAYQLIFLLAQSGLRPKEWSLLKWKDIKYFDNEEAEFANDRTGVEMSIHPSTKTGFRKAFSRGGLYLQRIEQQTKFRKKNDYVFTHLNGKRMTPDFLSDIFNGKGKCDGIVEATKLKELTGKEIVPYSLRHYYATQSIYSFVPDTLIAKNMGISVQRLHSSYDHAYLRVQTPDLFKRSTKQSNIREMRQAGVGDFAFFTRRTEKQLVQPTPKSADSKYGIFISDEE